MSPSRISLGVRYRSDSEVRLRSQPSLTAAIPPNILTILNRAQASGRFMMRTSKSPH